MRELAIAYGNCRQAKTWVNKTIRYTALKNRLRTTTHTTESAEEYARMSKAQRDSAKDYGGFVAGVLAGGRRKVETVELRSMITLDGDRISKELLENFETRTPYTSCLYSTHSHTPDNPRARLLFPLTRDVTPEEFVAVSRFLAQMLGIDFFDECSYQPNQLMYWPSTPSNGEYIFKEAEKEWLNPDTLLAAHPEWKDPTRLPTSSRESKANQISDQKVQDPLTKEGVVGLFNRVYFPVTKALETFLADVYEPTASDNRWHFRESGSMAGVVIQDEKFVYSHHAKDPAYLKLCNAFDIVRIHRFPDLDEKESFKAMCSFAMKLDDVKLMAANERLTEAEQDFSADSDWKKQLKYKPRSTELQNSTFNLRLILENDPNLKDIVFNKLADGMEIKGAVLWQHPAKFWRDADDAQLICYIEDHYGTFSQRNFDIAVTKVADDRSYHPIKQYFENLPEWDGTKRVYTLFIDYLGAEDNAYIRAVCRKTLCAAFMRVYVPGIKFDNIPVFNGAQGIGKSTFIANLGMEWFSDSLALSDMNDKTAAEKLQGYWIHEIGELAGMKKADLDKVKAFVSRRDDKYRASFGRRVTPHPRQCVFFGTTNSENGYLRDITGNRRFWNVKVSGNSKFKPWDMTKELVDQIWAEVSLFARDEELFLPHDLEAYAQVEQREAMEQDDREGLVTRYLELLLPENWESMELHQRRDFIQEPEGPLTPKGTVQRQTVTNIEIWCECFGKPELPDVKSFSARNLRYMHQFYCLFPILQQVVAKLDYDHKTVVSREYSSDDIFLIPWGHIVQIMNKVDGNRDKALFYIRKAFENNWSRAVLMNFLDTDLYERQGKAVSNFNLTLPAPQSDLAQDITRDPYTFDFLTLRESYDEKELKDALMDNITRFLLELGNGFAFVGREYRLEIGNTSNFIDMLFYNIKLHCYVVVEIKVKDFDSGDMGQLGTYMVAVNHQLKGEQDGPTLGLLICKSKDNVKARYALEASSQPMGISQYDITTFIPEKFKGSLPTIEEIEAEISSNESSKPEADEVNGKLEV